MFKKTTASAQANSGKPSAAPATKHSTLNSANRMCFSTSLVTSRSPPASTSAQVITSCQLCKSADTDEMVACDQCNKWFHFLCVNVNSSIENKDWSCKKCLDLQNATGEIINNTALPTNNCNTDNKSVRSKAKTTSSTRSRKAQLELQC